MSDRPVAVPRATYRLQLHGGFGFATATRLVPYLAALGVSHAYCSSWLRARRGSTHGYDVVDHNALNPELGSADAFARFVQALRDHRLGQVLDFVPNHMGVAQADNVWWLELLEWGRDAPSPCFFDVDWTPAKPELRDKVLLPFLGDHYGRVLERGELQLEFDRRTGQISAWYHEHRFPICPRDYPGLLGDPARNGAPARARRALGEILHGLGALPPPGAGPAAARRGRRLVHALGQLATRDAALAAWLVARVARLNGTPGRPATFVPLHRLLELQHWRLAFWRVAADEINYRRFFNVNDLAGLRVEDPQVFERVHRLVLRLVSSGTLEGLRIDHVDGLFDPAEYCRRLVERTGGRAWIVVEKILGDGEGLRDDWPVAGTTGYEFLNLTTGLLTDGRGAAPLARLYARFTGDRTPFVEVLYQARKHVMNFLLGSELHVLANELERLSELEWGWRDFTFTSLKEALKEVVACFPVYRTYVDAGGAAAADRAIIERAIAEARRRSADPETTLFDFLGTVLTADLGRDGRTGVAHPAVLHFAQKFQQYTGPVMAKSLEDTSFYRQPLLLALDEVGGDPRRFGVSVAAFHAANANRAARWPDSMLTTATHDTKRGEDVRARLVVVAEQPAVFGEQVGRFSRLVRGKRRLLRGLPAPRPKDEWALYQTLLGSWPTALRHAAAPDAAVLETYRSRVEAYVVKAAREAKEATSWRHPDEEYEAALTALVRALLGGDLTVPFLAEFLPFQQRIARLGVVNSLAQVALKLTAPGVPDIYQGAETWDLSLVDPDNRRPVDFVARARLLATLRRRFPLARPVAPATLRALLTGWTDGAVKLFLTWRLLTLRRRKPGLFARGGYVPLAAEGARAAHVCAFARVRGAEAVVVVVPRLPATLWGRADPLARPAPWGDTVVDCSVLPVGPVWRDAISGAGVRLERRRGTQRVLPLAPALETFPLAVLRRDG